MRATASRQSASSASPSASCSRRAAARSGQRARSISYRLQRARDVPARHHVGEGVVVYILVVLVRPDHVADVPLAVWLGYGAGRPEPRGLE